MPLIWDDVDPPAVTTDISDVASAVAAASSATPQPLSGLSVQTMSPTAAAGVNLSKFVLWIVTGTIGAMVTLLLFLECLVSWDITTTYRNVLNIPAVGAELQTLGQIEEFSTFLERAISDPRRPVDGAELQNGLRVIAVLSLLPSMSQLHRASLQSCFPPPQDDTRTSRLRRCLDVVRHAKQAATAQAGSVENLKSASEAASKLLEHRTGLHAFWIQAAQLVLLNLLLPLLTALFGYVFGTQQAQRAAS